VEVILDSCVVCLVYMRLWSRRDRVEVGKETCWGAEQGYCQLEVGRRTPGWDSLCPGRGTLEETHTAVSNTVTEEALRSYLKFCGCGFFIAKHCCSL
jgi:hypothetical protein